MFSCLKSALNAVKKASIIAGFLLGLTACQTPPHTQMLLQNPPNIAPQHIIADVPFYPQQDYYCGPTTLAEVANFYGQNHTPEQIAPNTFVPERKGTLQIEMKAAARQLGFLAYTEQGDLTQLLSLVEQDIPVIVLQNNSIELMPKWHYAVVIGYDMQAQQVILHTGVTESHRLNFATFERTWARGQYWMLAMLPPQTANNQLNAFIYTKAAQDLLDTNQQNIGQSALKTATLQWPDNWLAYFLLANNQIKQSPQTALDWFAKGFEYGKQQTAYLNNYAYALGLANCYSEAKNMIEQALKLSPEDENLLDTQAQLNRLEHNAVLIQKCPKHNVFNITSGRF
ncbi:PA2778 family cysteine peptidase [Catenovulum sp. 2E275]|uniref:PA2778 family cysteine peptidase n=1 Tax=Catenovulum sp. 2E275 TaxID=2980497 RepID=UPI0021D119CF|nr:PA2778 family cysteine peptidase [Catenovulum sp. 2E275]MCU4677271.1 PA2778 family cysteine peptidase [Catenovulum sp. 2E275]